jgi:hypoxanthine phosphoribosyltransferase
MSEHAEVQVLYDERRIAARVAEVGGQVTRAFEGRQVTVVAMMKGGLVFAADLIRVLKLDLTCHFLRSSSLRAQGAGARRTDIVFSTDVPYEGRDILLLESVVDTGITLNFLLESIREHQPRSLRVCALVDKPTERKIDVPVDWAAFTLNEPLPDGRFIVGYGLDYAERYRGLPYLGTIPRPATPAPGRKITDSPES